MTRRLISSGSTFEEEIGYSRAVVDGEWVFVSGTTGFNYGAMTISDSLFEQTEQCLRNIEAALVEAGASFSDVVRVTYVLPNAAEFAHAYDLLAEHRLTSGISIPDCLVAAMALARGDRLYSFNLKHFRIIAGLDVQQPYPRT